MLYLWIMGKEQTVPITDDLTVSFNRPLDFHVVRCVVIYNRRYNFVPTIYISVDNKMPRDEL